MKEVAVEQSFEGLLQFFFQSSVQMREGCFLIFFLQKKQLKSSAIVSACLSDSYF